MIFAMALESTRGPSRWASISPSPDGRWRYAWHDADGPAGHTDRDGPRDAIGEALRDGFQIWRETIGPDVDAANLMLAEVKAKRILAEQQIREWLRPDPATPNVLV